MQEKIVYPIRVLHCVAGLGRGGYETFIMNVYRNLDRSKIQFDFLYSFDGVFCDDVKALGGRLFKIPFITEKGPFAYHKSVINFLKSHPEYKIVHSHMDKFSGEIMADAKKCGVPVRIAHSHSTRNEGGIAFQLVKNYYGKKLLPNCTDRFACSDDAGVWLFGSLDGVTVVKNGVDTQKFAPRDERDKSAFAISSVARFTRRKNHTFLIDIFNEVVKKDDCAVLYLAGTGELQETIKEKVNTLNLSDKVFFLNDCNDVPRLLALTDVLCMPSLFEGLPVSLIETQSAGVPCVISENIPAQSDVTGNVTFVSLDTPAADWADIILSHKGQAKTDFRDKIVESGFDIHTTADFLQNFYLEKYGENI